MYIPTHFKGKDTQQAIAFMQRYMFATFVRVTDGVATATHLPIVVESQNDKILLSAHLALANPHSQQLDGAEVLVIFQEPHAYISPAHYDKRENVPTWNYIAIHCSGKVKVLAGREAQERLMEKTILTFEPAYLRQFKTEVSEAYKSAHFKAIVAFEIEVKTLEYKTKLSQNKSATERRRIAGALQQTEEGASRELGGFM